MANNIGDMIGNFRLVRLLGSGGFASVYLAQHDHMSNLQAAIKIAHDHLTPEEREEFKQEVAILAEFKNHYIPQVYDFDPNGAYITMEYTPDGSLREKHPEGSVVAVSDVLGYIKQVAIALQHVHDKGFVHCDVKPDNLLIKKEDRGECLLLTDFGIATAVLPPGTKLPFATGTVKYMAPEQIAKRPQPASDQYALGIMAYELLCGSFPFDGPSDTEIAIKHFREDPLPLRQKNQSIPVAVEQVIMQALARKPEDRFDTVEVFADALEQASKPRAKAKPTKPVAPPIIARPVAPVAPAAPVAPVLPPRANPVPMPVPRPAAPAARPPANPPGQQVMAPPQRRPAPQRNTTRRNFLILGLVGAGLTATGAIGYGLWGFAQSAQSTPSTSVQPTATTKTTKSASTKPTAKATQKPEPTPEPTEIPTGTTLYVYRGHTDRVCSVAWSPDSKYIASGGSWDDKTVQVWEALTGTLHTTYRGHTDPIWSVAWSPDSKYIASGSADNTAQVWEALTGTLYTTYQENTNDITSVAWSPDSKYIASGSARDFTVHVWEALTGALRTAYASHGFAVAWSPDGKYIVSGSGDYTVQVWEALTGKNVYTYRGHNNEACSVAWSPNGKYIASGSEDSTVQIWQALTGALHTSYKGHTSAVNSVSWSPNGKYIVSGSGDKTVQIWQALTGALHTSYKGHTSAVNSVSWSPNGKYIASGSEDYTVQVWQAPI